MNQAMGQAGDGSDAVPARVLVACASAHGSSMGIAKAIGETLRAAGLRVDVCPFDEVESVGMYDAFVFGSAVHDGRWLPAASAFVRDHGGHGGARPVWLFSVSSVGDTSSFFGPRAAQFIRKRRGETREVAGFRKSLPVRGHRNFAGVGVRAHWGLLGHVFLKVFGGTYGDHRDWADIETWAHGIATAVEAHVRETSDERATALHA